jgi:sec-independent protein translocase protein TatB
MFDLDPGKLIVIGIVALIAIPSKDLPRVLRTLGQATGRMRRMATEFQDQFMEAMREAELADLKKEVEETNRAIMAGAKIDGAFDPLAEARKQIVGAIEGADKKSSQEPSPHPEEPPSRVSKDEQNVTVSSLETQPPAAPRDEEAGDGAAREKADK